MARGCRGEWREAVCCVRPCCAGVNVQLGAVVTRSALKTPSDDCKRSVEMYEEGKRAKDRRGRGEDSGQSGRAGEPICLAARVYELGSECDYQDHRERSGGVSF